MIPTEMIDDYRKSLERATGKATDDLKGLWATLKQFDIDDIQDILSMSMMSLTAKYGDVAAVVSAEFYEKLRIYQRGGSYNTQLADNYADKIEAVVKRANLADTPKEELFSALLGMLDRYVLQTGRDTIMLNGYRDPLNPRYARIPKGEKTCAFCLMLAARGFVYFSRDKAGDTGGMFNSYHSFCDCQVVVDFSDHPGVEGYDPDKYYHMYLDARNTPSSDFDSLPDLTKVYGDTDAANTRTILAKIRRLYPNDVTDGVNQK